MHFGAGSVKHALMQTSIKSKKVTVKHDNERDCDVMESKLQSGECLYDSHRLTTFIGNESGLRTTKLCDLTTVIISETAYVDVEDKEADYISAGC